MKKWIIALLIAVPVLVFIAFYFSQKEDRKEDERDETGKPDVPIIRPPTINVGTPGINGVNPALPYDPFDKSKPGGVAVFALVNRYMGDDDFVRELMQSKNIGGKIFSGINGKPLSVIKNHVLGSNGSQDPNDLKLIPEFISSDFVSDLKRLINAPSLKEQRETIGKENAERNFIALCQFNKNGMSFCMENKDRVFDDWIRSDNAYGKCTQWTSKKREPCYTDHWVEWESDMKKLAKNTLEQTEAFESAIINAAIEKLILTGGWKFIGYN